MIAKEMWGALFLYALILSAGQLLFKKAALSTGTLASIADLRQVVFNPWLWIAFFLYVGATFLYVVILQRVPVSTAVLFNALCFVLVPLGAMALFGEALGWRHVIGVALIVAGLVVVTR
jgi:drug/metabolite transporter (DMT)-like permease